MQGRFYYRLLSRYAASFDFNVKRSIFVGSIFTAQRTMCTKNAADNLPTGLRTQATTGQVFEKLRTGMEWWKKYPIYQIYPRSFKDSNGDGVGDLKGITKKLDYFQWLGIKALWLSPIFKSPMKDFGYDICDYKDIDPMFGTMEDFKELMKAIREKGMYLILDFVPNHTSDQHPWFVASKEGKAPYKDFYIWRDGHIDPETKERKPPTDVMSVFGGPAWTWSEERQKYFLHHFLPEQPDLNYDNAHVRREMTGVLKHWVDLGVDGFRIDAVTFLGRDEAEHRVTKTLVTEDPEHDLPVAEHALTFETDRPPSSGYDILSQWVRFLRRTYESAVENGTTPPVTTNRHIFMCTEGYTDLASVMKYYDAGIDFPFNFALISWTRHATSHDLRKWVAEWMEKMPISRKEDPKKRKSREGDSDDSRWPNWVAGNHDQSRPATRLGGAKYADIINALLLTLPGTPTCYYGDELGMVDVPVTFEQCRDPYGKRFGPELYTKYTRDPCRSPMIWDAQQKYGGFMDDDDAKVQPWLPLHEDKNQFSVDKQRDDPRSHLNFFRRLVQLRDTESIFYRHGHNIKYFAEKDDAHFVYERYAPDDGMKSSYLIVLSVLHDGEDTLRNLDLSSEIDSDRKATIVLAACGDDDRKYKDGNSIDLSDIRLKSGDALILRLDSAMSEKKQKVDGE